MPPTSPIREQILDEVETVLKAIAAGSTYFNTIAAAAVERMRQSPLSQDVTPAVAIIEGDEQKSSSAIAGHPVPAGLTLCVLPLELHFIFRADVTTASENGNKLIHDLEVAMATVDGDIIGGALVRIDPTGNTLLLSDLSQPIWEGAAFFEVIYRHKRGNPSAAK